MARVLALRAMLADQCESASAFVQKEPRLVPRSATPGTTQTPERARSCTRDSLAAHGTRWQPEPGPEADSGSSPEGRERGSLAGTRPGLRTSESLASWTHGALPARGAVSTVLARGLSEARSPTGRSGVRVDNVRARPARGSCQCRFNM